MKYTAFIITLAATVFVCGCGPQIYTAPDFELVRPLHRTAAILPFDVIIDPAKLPNDFTLEMKLDAEKSEAYGFQRELYMQFLKQYEKGEYTIEFQDIDKTNALLNKAGITNADLSQFTREEIGAVVGTDVLISGTIHRSRPMSTGTAIAVGALFGIWSSTNEVNVSLNIHEVSSGNLMWNYDHKASGSVGSSSDQLAESLMKNVSKKFPYK
ncbi:MAG: hypothetical protein JSV52_10435 [Candidatus Zixiibacteriota bacterium]|nr:MAG: hypothetical protein JSV52_10435 [candidate division Zixibacteria bacterium]